MGELPEVLFTLPLPSSSLSAGGVSLRQRPQRTVALVCSWDDLASRPLALVFESLEALRCTYHLACRVDQINLAYDKVVDVGPSDWLRETVQQLRARRGDATGLRHLMIYFDDGPCYEFVCRGFHTEEGGGQSTREPMPNTLGLSTPPTAG